MGKRNLKEAIALVLEKSGSPLSCKDIAIIINDLYIYRHRDGRKVSGSQIQANTMNYSDKFEVSGGIACLKTERE